MPDKEFTPGGVGLEGEARKARAAETTWLEERAMWMRAAASAAANEVVETAPATAAVGLGTLALGGLPALAIPYLAGTMKSSENADVAAIGSAIATPFERAKKEQGEFNTEQLKKPLATRFTEGAANIVKGPLMLAGGAVGLGPLASPEMGAKVGEGLIRGPLGYYSALTDPQMSMETVAADPFAALLEAAPAAKASAAALRSTVASSAKKAAATGAKVGAGAKGLEVLAEILDPSYEGASQTAQKPAATVKESPGTKQAAADAAIAGIDEGVISRTVENTQGPVKTRPTLEGTPSPVQIVGDPKMVQAAASAGRALRGAMWGSVLLEPVTALTGLPLIGATAGALAVPAFKSAVRVVAKRKNMTPAEVSATIDRTFNDPNAVGRPDLREAVDDLMNARRTGASVESFSTAIGRIIEEGAGLIPPGGRDVRAAPEPGRIGVKMTLLPDGKIAYDATGVGMWFKHAADSADAAVRLRALDVLSREAKSEAASLKWDIATPQERKALATAVDRRRQLDAVTAANEKLLDRRVKIGKRLDEISERIGTDSIQSDLAAYRQFRNAFLDFENAAGGPDAAPAVRDAINEFRRARRERERGVLTGTRRMESAQDWFRGVVEQIGPHLDDGLIAKAQAAAAQLDALDAHPTMKQWTQLVAAQDELGANIRALNDAPKSYKVSWEFPGSGRRNTQYESTKAFVAQLNKEQQKARAIMEEVDKGAALTPDKQAVLNKAQAMRAAVDEHALDFMMLVRERGKISSALDTIVDHFGGSPGQVRKSLAIELKTLRAEAAEATRAEARLRGAVNKLSAEQGLNADVILRAQDKFERAKSDAIAKNANIEALTSMLDSVDALFRRQVVENASPDELAARAVVRSDVELERRMSVNDAIALEFQREIAELIDVNGDVKAAFDASIAAQKIEATRKQAKTDLRNQFPAPEQEAQVRSGLASFSKPMSMVSLEWNNAAVQEMVERIAAMASEWSPFGSPIDPILVRRMFSMAAMDNGIIHLMNKRAVGAMGELFAAKIPGASKATVAEVKNTLSKTIAQAVADSIKSKDWVDPVFTLPDGQTVQMSTAIASWMQTLSKQEKQRFMGDTARSLGKWISKQIQAHHMQGALASDIASQMVVGDRLGRATPHVSFVSWAIGESDKMVAPFNVAQMRQMLGTPESAVSFLQESMRYVPQVPLSDLLMQRLTPEGVVQWMASLDNYVQVVGSDVRAKESKSGAMPALLGGVGLGAAGFLAGGGDVMASAMGASGGALAGAVMTPQIVSAFTTNHNNLRTFLQQVGGDLSTQGYAPLTDAYVHRGVAAALDAQVSYIKNVSRTEALMKIMLTAFSLPTSTNNMLSNALLKSLWGGTLPGDLIAKDMPQAALTLAQWRKGKLDRRNMEKWTAFAGTGLMETSVLGDVLRDWGTGQAGGAVQGVMDTLMKVVTSAYAAQDGLAKAAVYGQQYDMLAQKLELLGPGSSMFIDQGGGRYKKATKVGDNIHVQGKGGASTALAYDSKEFAELVASGAKVAAANMFFDFSSLPNILRRHDGSMLSAYAAPLFGWAYKSIDLPGKHGLVTAAIEGAPSTNFLTNDPVLLKQKAAELGELAIRRTVLMSMARADAEASEENDRLAKMTAWGVPMIPWVTSGGLDEGVVRQGDFSAMLPFSPTVLFMNLGANGVTGAMDLLGYGPESREPQDVSGLSAQEVSAESRERNKWNRFWFNLYSGKGGTPKDMVRMFGISGNFLFPLMAAMQNRQLDSTQAKAVAAKTFKMMFPKTPVDVLDVLVGVMMPDSMWTSRKVVNTEEGPRYADAFLWTAKTLTGIGVVERGLEDVDKTLEFVAKRVTSSMLDGVQDHLNDIEKQLEMSNLTPERQQQLELEADKLQGIIDRRRDWLDMITSGGEVFDPREGWK